MRPTTSTANQDPALEVRPSEAATRSRLGARLKRLPIEQRVVGEHDPLTVDDVVEAVAEQVMRGHRAPALSSPPPTRKSSDRSGSVQLPGTRNHRCRRSRSAIAGEGAVKYVAQQVEAQGLRPKHGRDEVFPEYTKSVCAGTIPLEL